MEAPQPPHNTTIYHATGVAYLVQDEYDGVREKIAAAYADKNPFIDVTDNYGRGLSIPVHHILGVLAA